MEPWDCRVTAVPLDSFSTTVTPANHTDNSLFSRLKQTPVDRRGSVQNEKEIRLFSLSAPGVSLSLLQVNFFCWEMWTNRNQVIQAKFKFKLMHHEIRKAMIRQSVDYAENGQVVFKPFDWIVAQLIHQKRDDSKALRWVSFNPFSCLTVMGEIKILILLIFLCKHCKNPKAIAWFIPFIHKNMNI